MPEARGANAASFGSALQPYQRRLRLASLSSAVLVGAVSGSLVLVLLSAGGVAVRYLVPIAVGTAAAATVATGWVWWRRWPMARVALVVDRSQSLDNLVVTAQEIAAGRIPSVRVSLAAEIFRQASERLAGCEPTRVAPIARPAGLAVAAATGLVALLLGVSGVRLSPREAMTTATESLTLAPGDLRVIVTPPAYARRESTSAINPTSVTALEGSRVRLEMGAASAPFLVGVDARVPFDRVGGVFAHDLTASEPVALVVRQSDSAASAATDRLLYLAVQPDAPPVVTIRTPAKDLLFGESVGTVAIDITARDDLALQALDLRFTRVTGSGEGFTFKEGTLPVAIARSGAGEWTGKATIALDALKLEEGDTLVYHAIARDQRPGAPESVSESFLIEIGKVAGIASTGFALPDDRERQALSQQMLIVKTERLEAQRATLSPDAFAEQAKLLGIEQRMVRAEFVFMTGGEVEDEVEEAAASHELTEGRLENRGQSELLTAVREMSRAEARLNAADTKIALGFERAALKALQRAFDRRRYLLRATPERARIDLARRLTGDLAAARSSTQEARAVSEDPLVSRTRAAMTALARRDASAPLDAVLAAELLAVDARSEALRNATLRLSAATTPDARSTATRDVADALQSLMRAHLHAAAGDRLPPSALRGRLADELAKAAR